VNEEPKKPVDRAKDTLEKGLDSLFKAAGEAASAVKRETKRASKDGPGLGKALDDAGREVVRAASNVATFLGSELSTWGKKLSPDDEAALADKSLADKSLADKSLADKSLADKSLADKAQADGARASAAGGDDEPWPKTREEYEKKYGKDGADWPKSRKEYEEKYGRPPRKRGDDDDPGYRIA
jgi:hypothetical protein